MKTCKTCNLMRRNGSCELGIEDFRKCISHGLSYWGNDDENEYKLLQGMHGGDGPECGSELSYDL
jgi:hypothetical protein